MAKARGRSRKDKGPALITDARGSRIRNFDHRRHVYAVLQWSRLPLLLLAGASIMWWDNKWLAAIFIVVSVPLSWIAVVIANGVGEPADKRAPRVYKPAVVREQNRRWEEAQKAAQLEQSNPRRLELPTSPARAHGSASHPAGFDSADSSSAGSDSARYREGNTSESSIDADMIIDMPTDLPDN